MKKILIADNAVPFLDRINVWLHDVPGYVVIRARHMTEARQFNSELKHDLTIVGELGPKSQVFARALKRTDRTVLTMWDNDALPDIPYLPRNCTREELLTKIRELLGE